MRRLGVLTVSVSGAARLQREGLLVLANHPTLIDVVLLVALLPDADCVVKRAVARNPFMRATVRAAGYIVNDDGPALVEAGIAKEIVAFSSDMALTPLMMGWLVAALMRIATGSATVAMSTAAGIVAPIALAAGYPHPELLVIATGAGSLILSHVNDGGFWLIKEYFNMTVTQTLKTWTVLETIISFVALAFVSLLAAMM